MDLEKLGRFIAKMRKSKDLTQEKLGEKLSVHPKTISKWERGISAPDISLLLPLSKIFGISVNELLNCKINDVSSNATVDAIKYYTNNSKIKYIKYFLCILLALCIIFSSVLYTINYNKLNLYKIDTIDNGYAVQGYLVYNHNKKIISIDKIEFNDEYIGTDKETFITDINLELYANNQIIYSIGYNELSEKESESISSILNKIHLCLDANNEENNLSYNDLKNLKIHIKYTTSKDKEKYYNIKLNLIKSN